MKQNQNEYQEQVVLCDKQAGYCHVSSRNGGDLSRCAGLRLLTPYQDE